MKNKKTKLSQAFQRWLIVLVAFAFLATTISLWFIQTGLSEKNAISLLKLNMADVHEDIIDASDGNLLKLAREIADRINTMDKVAFAELNMLKREFDVTEINTINSEGVITASTYPDFLHYNMRSGEQSAEFLCLLSGAEEYVQSR